MLAKQYRLVKTKDFELLFKKGKPINGKFIFLKLKRNKLKLNRFAIIVSLKVSKKAVIRNKIKRRIREVIKKTLDELKNGFDIVIVSKPEIVGKTYQEIEKEIKGLFKKAEIL